MSNKIKPVTKQRYEQIKRFVEARGLTVLSKWIKGEDYMFIGEPGKSGLIEISLVSKKEVNEL